MDSLEQRIKQQAHVLGFELAGIAAATPADSLDRLRDWLDRGYAGEMGYMHRQAQARANPASILTEVRSVVMVGMNYKPEGGGRWAVGSGQESGVRNQAGGRDGVSPPITSSVKDQESEARLATGKVARYARGVDYHDVLRRQLNRLLAWIQEKIPDCRGRGVVDTAPLLERDFARRAGLGWFGKNTMLLNKRMGSFFFIGALLLDLELQSDPVHETSHCGSCTACLDACPTQAFAGPGWLDSRRCLSYLTIELREPVPEPLREHMNDWLFGCDVCQEVCPWNRKAPAGTEPALQSRSDLETVDLVELLGLDNMEFRRRFRGTALMRARRRGLLRNAALILGNRGDATALPALRQALTDSEPLIREAAQWAIERIMAVSSAGSVPASPSC